MDLSALMTLGFLGLSSASFGDMGPIPIGAGVGAPTSGDFNSAAIRWLSVEPKAQAAPAGITVSNFTPADFPFVTTIPDDGTDKGGGWQVAKVNLEFISIVIPTSITKWYCTFTIQMPLRTEFMGKVDATRAAKLSKVIANTVAPGIDRKLPQGIFCHRFMAGMRGAFATTYPFLGASVIK